MFKVNTSRTKRTCVTLTHVFEFFNFSECLCGSVLKDYLGESRTLFNLNKLAGKVEKSDIYWSTVISIYDCTTKISKANCKAGPRCILPK